MTHYQYLAYLAACGPKSDHAVAEHFGWALSSVCSIRNGVYDQIVAAGFSVSPYGRTVTTWTTR